MGAFLVFRVELFLVSFTWHGSREVAHHPLLVESTSVQFLAPTWWLPTIYSSSNRRTNTYFGYPQVPGMNMVHIYIHAGKTVIHMK